jgi:hypothetical protein
LNSHWLHYVRGNQKAHKRQQFLLLKLGGNRGCAEKASA